MVLWRRIKNKMKTRAKVTLQAASLMLSGQLFLFLLSSNIIITTMAANYSHLHTCAKSPETRAAEFFHARLHIWLEQRSSFVFFRLVCMSPRQRGT